MLLTAKGPRQEILQAMDNNKQKVLIFDTTLRDGEQSPGATLDFESKMRIAKQLDALGVDFIEAGFPITSKGDFEAVRAIAAEVTRPTITGLARCVRADVERAGEAFKDSPGSRIHVFCATSKIHLEHKLRKAFDEIVRISVDHINLAREFVDDVEFSPEDGSRTEINYLVEIAGAAIEAGASTINIPDTVGYAVPQEFGAVFRQLREQLPVIDEKGIVLSAHCHNDLGLAVANSIAAIQNGARQVECTINGIGERAGNASLEEVVMALRTRRDVYGLDTNIVCEKIYPTSRMVSQSTGLLVQRNKAIVGENAFAHEAGIHQDGVLKERSTYEIMDPKHIGLPSNKLVLGKHSGRHAFGKRVEEMGYSLDDSTSEAVFEAFKALCDKKKNVYDEDIEALVENQMEQSQLVNAWKLIDMQVTAGSSALPTATIKLQNPDGEVVMDASIGDGPVDAIYSAIRRITGVKVTLTDYKIRALTIGRDAQGEVFVKVKHGKRTFSGKGVSTDVIDASARAYLAAINRVRRYIDNQNGNGHVENISGV
jgi:2-isopropylmalate synthase